MTDIDPPCTNSLLILIFWSDVLIENRRIYTFVHFSISFQQNLRGKKLQSALHEAKSDVCSIVVFTWSLNIEPVAGLVVQSNYSSRKTKKHLLYFTFCICAASHTSAQKSIVTPILLMCVHCAVIACVYVGLVAELLVSARVFSLLLIVLPTIAVNDSAEWLHRSAMGDGRAQKGKTHFQKHTRFLFINLNASWPAVAFMSALIVFLNSKLSEGLPTSQGQNKTL